MSGLFKVLGKATDATWNLIASKPIIKSEPDAPTWNGWQIQNALQYNDVGWSKLVAGRSEEPFSRGLRTSDINIQTESRGKPIIKPEPGDQAWTLYPFILVTELGHLGKYGWMYECVESNDPLQPGKYDKHHAVVYRSGMTMEEYKVIRLVHAIACKQLILNVVGTHIRTSADAPSIEEPFGFVVREWAPVATPSLIDLRGPGLFIRHALEHIKRLHKPIDGYWVALQTFDASNFLFYKDRVEMASYEDAILYKNLDIVERSAVRTDKSDYFPDKNEKQTGTARKKITDEDVRRFHACLDVLGISITYDEILDMYNEINV